MTPPKTISIFCPSDGAGGNEIVIEADKEDGFMMSHVVKLFIVVEELFEDICLLKPADDTSPEKINDTVSLPDGLFSIKPVLSDSPDK